MMSHRGGDLEAELERRVRGIILVNDGSRRVVMEEATPMSPLTWDKRSTDKCYNILKLLKTHVGK